MDGKRGVAIYTRVSTDKQERDGASLGTQEADCRAKVAALGYDPHDAVVYQDVFSGHYYDERPALTRLREDIRRQRISLVVCHSLDRIARESEHMTKFFSDAAFCGIEIALVHGQIEDTFEGKLMRQIMGTVAEAEWYKFQQRARDGHAGRVRRGLPTTGVRAPLGLMWADKERTKLIENPETSGTLRRIFHEVAAGSSARQVALRLSAEGIPTATGLTTWRTPTICKIIRNPIYEGRRDCLTWEVVHETVPGVGRKVRHKKRAAEDVVTLDGIAPILVAPELVLAARTQLPYNKTYSVRNMRNPELALLRGGHVFCGQCGKALGLNKARGHYSYVCTQRDRYGCAGFGIATHKLDALAWQKVREIVLNPDLIKREVAQQSADDPTAGDLAFAEKRLRELRRRQANLAKSLAVIDDEDAASAVRTELITLSKQAKSQEDEIAHLQARHALVVETQQWADGLDEWCELVRQNIDDFSYEEKRIALRSLRLEVRVWPSDHDPRIEIRVTLLESLATTGTPWR